MKLYSCAVCHNSFYSSVPDDEAITEFEAQHRLDIASTPVVAVCTPCYESAMAAHKARRVVSSREHAGSHALH